MTGDIEAARQLDRHLRAPRQVWLTGAGISFGAGLPLMYPLTERVFHLLANDAVDDDAVDVLHHRAIRLCPQLPRTRTPYHGALAARSCETPGA